MKRGVRFFFSMHQITGCVIALFFLMWFVSGLVLIYHPFPRLSEDQLYEKKEVLPSSLPDIQTIERQAGGKIKRLHLRQFQQQTLATVTTADSTFTFCCTDSLAEVKPITFDYLEKTAQDWVNAPILKVDTLHERAQWVLYSRYERVLPIYKFYFDDSEKHELFISGKNGDVQQLSTRSERIWAWFGAIPHKLYIPAVRKDLDLWKGFITVGALFCVLASLSGIFVGFYVLMVRHRQTRRWESPYRKRWFYLHHVVGLIFSFFLLAWGISGYFSMNRIPQWLIDSEGKYIFSQSSMWGKKSLSLNAYKLDYRQLKSVYPDLKEVRWTHFRDIPAYEIIAGDQELVIDASTTQVKELYIPQETVIAGLKHIHGDDVKYDISVLNEYDDYYLSRKHATGYTLPVYKILVDDNISSRYYVNPKTGYVRYLNNNKMVRKWVFSGIHYLNIKWLIDRPVLWTICIWVLCLGCSFVCLSGAWLGYKYLKRKMKI